MTTPPATRSRRRFDHDAAFAAFVAQGPSRTYGAVASQYGVTEGAIRKVAKRDNWLEKAAALDAAAGERALAKAIRVLDDRNADTVRVAERLRAVALAEDADIPLPLAIQVLPQYAKLEQLFAGEATERIDPGQVQQVLAIVLRLGVRALPPDEFLAEFNRAVAGVLEAPRNDEQAAA